MPCLTKNAHLLGCSWELLGEGWCGPRAELAMESAPIGFRGGGEHVDTCDKLRTALEQFGNIMSGMVGKGGGVPGT